MALNRVPIPSPNYSNRGGAAVRLLVLHTAEGARTIESLGSFFQNPGSGVSSHTGADDKVNTVGEFVQRPQKAWTASNANPVACQIEMCAFAAWDNAEWHRHPNMLQNVASWLSEEAAAFGIPLTLLNPQQAQGGGRGVCQHRDLGSWGGNHSDCGNGFPVSEVLAMAGGQPGPAPGPTPPPTTGTAPPFPGTNLVNFTSGHGTSQWQGQMRSRGWSLAVDDLYGNESERICRQFQSEAVAEGHDTGGVDGIVGPKTWALAWTKPLTP
jgi:hypothetical protein